MSTDEIELTTEDEERDKFELIAEEHDIDEYAFRAYCDNHHIDEEDLVSSFNYVDEFRESYCGHYHCEAQFAQHWAEEQGDTQSIPDYILDCVDWQDVWDGTLRHDFWSHEGHIFQNF